MLASHARNITNPAHRPLGFQRRLGLTVRSGALVFGKYGVSRRVSLGPDGVASPALLAALCSGCSSIAWQLSRSVNWVLPGQISGRTIISKEMSLCERMSKSYHMSSLGDFSSARIPRSKRRRRSISPFDGPRPASVAACVRLIASMMGSGRLTSCAKPRMALEA